MGDPGPLSGLRVVELASWVMAPGASAVLAAYGADVIKVEPAGAGDPSRGSVVGVDGVPVEAGFELVNNRKRSIQLNLSIPDAREIMLRLLDRADVFVTNVRQKSLERLGLDSVALHQRFPRLIVAHATGYGPQGVDRDRPAFDELAYWSRSGIASALQTDDNPPVSLTGAMGDLPSAISLVAGVTMALYRRERDGRGGIVDVSLYQCGIWTNGWALQPVLLGARSRRKRGRRHSHSPLYTCYQCADGKWVQFAMLQPTRYWAALCDAIGRPDLVEDPRFSDYESLISNSALAIDAIQDTVGSIERDELGRRLDERDLPWSPIFTLEEVVHDQQAQENHYFVPKQHRSGRSIQTISPPFTLRGVDLAFGPAPESGQDTELVLGELGLDWEQIGHLRERGAI